MIHQALKIFEGDSVTRHIEKVLKDIAIRNVIDLTSLDLEGYTLILNKIECKNLHIMSGDIEYTFTAQDIKAELINNLGQEARKIKT